MTTINTPDDLIQGIRNDPNFRATVRRELLTAELLEVPTRLSTLEKGITALVESTEAINRRLDSMDGRFDTMDSRFDSVDGRFDTMDSRFDSVDGRLDSIESDVKMVRRDTDGLGEAFRREVRAQSSFRGNYAQGASRGRTIHIAGDLARSLGLGRVKTRLVPRSMPQMWLEENYETVEALGLRERAWETFLVPDVLVEVRNLRAPNDTAPAFYIAVEASYTAYMEDMLRATDHAKILRSVTGLDAYPVVSSVMIVDELAEVLGSTLYEDAEQFTRSDDADAAYWYRLDSADLRPSEPR